jgi:hypothetical protein
VPLIRNGGKVNRDQKGWGRLPKSVLQYVQCLPGQPLLSISTDDADVYLTMQ